MKIETVRINQNVYAPGGHVGRVVEISQNGQVHLDFGPNNFHYVPVFVGDIEPVSDPCQSCEMAPVITDQCKQIAELQKERDSWKATAHQYCRNATYWREELEKLQKEALADLKPIHPAIHIEDFRKRPLSEVAKCYIRVSPEELERILKGRD